MPSPRPPFYQLAVPGPAITAPRDGLPLQQTSDSLFLAVLHERSRSTGWVIGEGGGDGQRSFQPCRPPADPSLKRRDSLFVSCKHLRRLLVFTSPFFAFRRLCQQPTPNGASLSVADHALTQDGAWSPTDFGGFYLTMLTPPIGLGQPDALIRELSTQPLFSWCDLTAAEPATAVHGGDWICPNCGIISATHGSWCRPPPPGTSGGGQSYTYQLCVTCLITFDCQPTAHH